jgi:hypothetical protein
MLERLLARKSVLPLMALTVYLVVAAWRLPSGLSGRGFVVGLAAIGLGVAALRTTTRWELWAASVVVASVAAPGARGWHDVFGMAGATLAGVGALRSLGAMPAPESLAARPTPSRWPEIASTLAASAIAISCVALHAQGASHPLAAHPFAWQFTAHLVGLAALLVQMVRVWHARRLELGIVPRVRAGAVSAVAAVSFFAVLAVLAIGPADKALRLGVTLASCLVVRVVLAPDANAIARTGRRAFALLAFGGPVAVLGALAVADAGLDAPGVALVTALIALVLGALVPMLERPLRPAQGALLDATSRAREALRRSDANEALREVLLALREPAGVKAGSPELWTCDPGRTAYVDTAGYLHERASTWPNDVARLAAREPEATLRTAVLESLEVRRTDLRPALQWMRDRGAIAATLVVREAEPEGLLVVLAGNRDELLTWEEARELKELADGLAAACHAKSAQARGLERERALHAKLDEGAEQRERLQHEIDLQRGRDERMSLRLARPATVGIYSAASRLAYEALERRVRIGAPLAIVAPSGVDAVPYLARAHLQGPRAAAPLVLVEGTASREHDVERWRDPIQSPLALADRGMLVLLDGAALPLEVQRIVARALAERRPPWEGPHGLDAVVALTGVRRPDALRESGELDEALAARLGDALESPIVLPGLRDRAEDLRAIVTERLAREGLRTRGRPVGMDDAAFARLVEHDFPGEDAELAALVQRLVAACTGDVIRASDVDALGLVPAPAPMAAKGPRRL